MQYLMQSTFPIRLRVSYAHRTHATPVSHPLSVRVTDITRDPRALIGHLLQAPAADGEDSSELRQGQQSKPHSPCRAGPFPSKNDPKVRVCMAGWRKRVMRWCYAHVIGR